MNVTNAQTIKNRIKNQTELLLDIWIYKNINTTIITKYNNNNIENDGRDIKCQLVEYTKTSKILFSAIFVVLKLFLMFLYVFYGH